MLKVQATNGNSFEFEADSWRDTGSGLILFKGSDAIAQFSAYNFVQRIPDPVVDEPESPPEVTEPEFPTQLPAEPEEEPNEDSPV